MIRYYLFILLLLFFTDVAHCQRSKQKVVITGTVIDGNMKPVSNAIVMIDNQKTGSVTDIEGKFRVRINPEANRIGIFSIQYGIIEEDIAGRQKINLVYTKGSQEQPGIPVNKAEQEAIIDANTSYYIGYNYIKKRDMVNNISVLDPSKTKKTYSSVYQMITEMPGVQIINGQINIGGTRNMFGFVGPVILVDGIERSPSDFQPWQVESIAVLKDAAAAIYGSRAFGGAIIIKLKPIQVEK